MADPLVAHLTDCRVTYDGRSRSTQRGGDLVVIVKADGTVIAHAPTGGVRPQFYNPAGAVRVRRRGARLTLTSVCARGGETLTVSGRVVLAHPVTGDAPPRPARKRVRGLENDLVQWIQADPARVGLKDRESAREVKRVGGRVDLAFGRVVVEVKRQAGVATFDQAQRYLRDPDVREVRIACLGASRDLVALCESERRVRLVLLDADAFHAACGMRAPGRAGRRQACK